MTRRARPPAQAPDPADEARARMAAFARHQAIATEQALWRLFRPSREQALRILDHAAIVRVLSPRQGPGEILRSVNAP